jgi:branched-subunit amino acid aminotransferase/4-amino-4-deoxychorismate lyase
VTEAAAANVFWSVGDILRTPAASLPIYPGVTRAVVLEAARHAGFEVDEGEHTATSIATAEGVFLTNATRGVEPVTELDGESAGWPEPLARLAAAVADRRRSQGTRL